MGTIVRSLAASRALWLAGSMALWFGLPSMASAQPLEDPHATTELTCSFGMAKGEASQKCQVPFPAGCVVARIPGTTKPWTSVSKGGKTACRFHEKETDWKTRITGICGRCTSAQCSAKFHVRFDCSNR